jgi:hypothetical protein
MLRIRQEEMEKIVDTSKPQLTDRVLSEGEPTNQLEGTEQTNCRRALRKELVGQTDDRAMAGGYGV